VLVEVIIGGSKKLLEEGTAVTMSGNDADGMGGGVAGSGGDALTGGVENGLGFAVDPN
jgi:hypothetical protein